MAFDVNSIPSSWWDAFFTLAGLAVIGIANLRFASRAELSKRHEESTSRFERIEARQQQMPGLSDVQRLDERVRGVEQTVAGMSGNVSAMREDLRDVKDMIRSENWTKRAGYDHK